MPSSHDQMEPEDQAPQVGRDIERAAVSAEAGEEEASAAVTVKAIQPLTCVVCEETVTDLENGWVRPTATGPIFGLHNDCAKRIGNGITLEWNDHGYPVISRPKPRCVLMLDSGERVTVEGDWNDLAQWHESARRLAELPPQFQGLRSGLHAQRRRLRPVRRFQTRTTYSGDPKISIDVRHVAAVLPLAA